MARSPEGIEKLKALGATPVEGDITDSSSMLAAMRGCEVVFHTAALYEVGARYRSQMARVNVDGARIVFETALEAGVPKIVFTSTAGVCGDTKGKMVDETYHVPLEALRRCTEYERTKWRAHYEVALPMIARGAPIVIVMPGGTFGPEDHSVVGGLVKQYARGLLPLLPDKETTFTYTYVDDVAEGHILAAEKGRAGQSYMLGHQPIPLGEFTDLWAEVSGRRRVRIRIPAAWVRPSWVLMALIEKAAALPPVMSSEAIRELGITWIVSSAKAVRELGWKPRPIEEGLKLTFDRLNEMYDKEQEKR